TGSFVSRRTVQLLEEGDSVFALRASKDAKGPGERVQITAENGASAFPPGLTKTIKGNRVEVVLQPSHFVFRQLELPRRAVEFLDGIIRAQIDRLTPWSPSEAVFGWGRPTDISTDRFAGVIAATGRAQVMRIVRAAVELGAGSVALVTAAADAGTARIKVYEQNVRGVLDARRLSRALFGVLVAAVAAAAVFV